jgi:hypothetical protein
MRIRFLLPILFLTLALSVSAQKLTTPPRNEIISAYRQYQDMPAMDIAAPTVVEISFDGQYFERTQFAVYDQAAAAFEPSWVRQEVSKVETPVSIVAGSLRGAEGRMADGNLSTYAEYPLPENTEGRAQFSLITSAPAPLSGFTLLLDNHVALPTSVGIRAMVEGAERIVVAERRMDQTTIRFPQTTSAYWIINLSHAQPLRIAEIKPSFDNVRSTTAYYLRFLARPTHSYRVYLDPDRNVQPPVGEAGNLAANEGVVALTPMGIRPNSQYRMADVDGDGIADVRDNCVDVANRDQADVNGNGRGDACDDFDRDGILNSKDNCPEDTNRAQIDTDGDGIGDACDEQESRLTERLPWLPWVGIGAAALVVIVLLIMTARMPAGSDTVPKE